MKKLRDYQLEAEQINQQAQEQGQPAPIPNFEQLNLRPLAQKVLQARLDLGKRGKN